MATEINIHRYNPLTATNAVVGLDFQQGYRHFEDLVHLLGNNAAQIAVAQIVSGIRSVMHQNDVLHLCMVTANSSFINTKDVQGVDLTLCNILVAIQTEMKKWQMLGNDISEEWELERITTYKIFLRPINYSVQIRAPIFGHNNSDEETITL